MDYGLIAFKRSEENIKQSLKQKFNTNFFHKNISGVLNAKYFVASIKTLEEKLISFYIYCSANCEIKIYVNGELQYAQNINNFICVGLNIYGEANLEIEFVSTEQSLLTSQVSLVGDFKNLKNETLSVYYTNNTYFLVSTYNEKTSIFNNSSLDQLIADYNTNSNKETVKKYVTGVNTLTDFYYLKYMGQLQYLANSTKSILLPFAYGENCILTYDGGENKFIVFAIINNSIKASFIDENNNLYREKIFDLPNGVYIKKLFQVQNLDADYSSNYFMFSDVNNNLYLVLCNYQYLFNLSQKMLNCITLSVKAENACGYKQNNSLTIEVNGVNKVNEIVINNLISLSKQSDKKYNNLTSKLLLPNNLSILNFNGYLVKNETN